MSRGVSHDRDQTPASQPPPKPSPSAKEQREARLAAALRANLRRRKAGGKAKPE